MCGCDCSGEEKLGTRNPHPINPSVALDDWEAEKAAAQEGKMLPSLTLALTACLDPPQSINKLPCISQGRSWGKQAAQPSPPKEAGQPQPWAKLQEDTV